MFKKNDYIIGVLLALPAPVLFYLLIPFFSGIMPEKSYAIPLVGVFINVIMFRYFMINVKLEKTGRGILLVTFIELLFFFMVLN